MQIWMMTIKIDKHDRLGLKIDGTVVTVELLLRLGQPRTLPFSGGFRAILV
jgi:hypothetical protein